MLCIAPGSPAESITNLLRLTETDIVLAHGSQMKAARAAVEVALNGEGGSVKPRAFEMLPDVIDVLHSGTSPDKKQEEDDRSEAGPEDVLVTMHTSGSSGLPKPIYQLHRFWTTSMLSAPGRNLSAFTTTPLFHGGMSDMLRSIQAGSTIFFHPLQTLVLSQRLPFAMQSQPAPKKSRTSSRYPTFWICSSLTAPIPVAKCSLQCSSLAQEAHPSHSNLAIRWCSRYQTRQSPRKLRVRLPHVLLARVQQRQRMESTSYTRPARPVDDSVRTTRSDHTKGGLFELIVTKDWPTKLVANRDDGGYATSDLYCAHETLPNTWRYDSRADDTIVLVSGKKATAPLAEQKLKASSLVSEAIVFGANRAILGALVFVTSEAAGGEGEAFDDEIKVKILQELQPTLAEINAASPPHAQLATEMVHLLPLPKQPTFPERAKEPYNAVERTSTMPPSSTPSTPTLKKVVPFVYPIPPARRTHQLPLLRKMPSAAKRWSSGSNAKWKPSTEPICLQTKMCLWQV